jgi:hypothetical protein
VIEVSWSSRRRDLRKAPIYAGAAVPAYWRLDLDSRTLEVRQRPTDAGYELLGILQASDEVELPESNVRWKVSDLLPPQSPAMSK